MSYERAVSMHTAAREMVYVAEQGLMADGKNTLDPTWQEMLNHATSKVTKRRRDTCSPNGVAVPDLVELVMNMCGVVRVS